MKRLDLINKDYVKEVRQGLMSKMLMKQCLSTMAYLQKKKKPLPPVPELSDFYHRSEVQKNGELIFVAVSTGIATFALYKYLK